MSSEDVSQDVSQQLAENISSPVQQQEPMISQSKVNELVANAKLVSAEKARKETESKYQAMAQQQQPQGQMQGGMPQQGQMQQPSMEEQMAKLVEQKIAEKEQSLVHNQQRQMINELAHKFDERIEKGSESYSDFKKVVGKFNPGKFPGVTIMAAQMDNTADIMYDLMSNPVKLAGLQKLAEVDQELAFEEMQKLSSSIKRNEEALNSNQQRTSAPLSKLKASIAGADNGKKTIKDLRKLDYLKV